MTAYYGVMAIRAKGDRYFRWDQLFREQRREQPDVPEGKRLIAMKRTLTSSGTFWEVAGDVTTPAEWSELLQAYEESDFDTLELFLVDESLLRLCPDEGRVFFDGPHEGAGA